MMANQGASFVLGIVSVAVLARLLTPADFGLIAMVTAITGVVTMFKDAGLSMATVQRETVTHEQVSTLFWINIALSIALVVILAALAPVIAWFYGEPRLIWVTLAFAGIFLLGGLSIQHEALLRRQMRFTALAAISTGSMAVAIAAAISAAALGLGYWSLVIQVAVSAAANVVLVWLSCGWRPKRAVRGSGVRPMLAFGGNLTAFTFINYFARNADNVLVGWWWGAGPLGFYSKAYQLLMLPITQINGPMSSVALPALSRLQDDPVRFKRFYFKAIGLMVSLGMPLVAFLFVEARDVILLVLGHQWLPAVPIFRALGVAAFVGTFNVASGWVYTALGRTDRMLKWQLIMTPLTLASFVIGLPWGVLGVAIAFSAVNVVMRLPGLLYCYAGTSITLREFILAIWEPAVASIVAAAATYLIMAIWTAASALVATLSSLVLFSTVYLLLMVTTAGGRAMIFEVLRFVRDVRQRAEGPGVIPEA